MSFAGAEKVYIYIVFICTLYLHSMKLWCQAVQQGKGLSSALPLIDTAAQHLKEIFTLGNNIMRMILNMIPPTTTAQEKKINYKTKKVYSAPAVVDAKAKYRAHLAKYRPDHPMTGPLYMNVIWCFPMGKHAGGYCTDKPDLDNANKLLQDVLQELGFFEDDKQIAKLQLTKIYAEDPCVMIFLEECDDD